MHIRLHTLLHEKHVDTSLPLSDRLSKTNQFPVVKETWDIGKLETTGSVLDIHAGGKPLMSDQTVADVKQRLQQSQKKSLRKLSQETGLSYSNCQRAAKKAKLKAYCVTVIQELKPLDTQKRMAHCEWLMNLFGKDD